MEAKRRGCINKVCISISNVETEHVCWSCSFCDEMQKFAKFCSSTKYSWLPMRNVFFSIENQNWWKYILQRGSKAGPASDLPSKSFTWKDINSNSIAIQTSPSLKGWRDEWRNSSNDAFASSRENVRVHVKSKHSEQVYRAFCNFHKAPFCRFASQ